MKVNKRTVAKLLAIGAIMYSPRENSYYYNGAMIGNAHKTDKKYSNHSVIFDSELDMLVNTMKKMIRDV